MHDQTVNLNLLSRQLREVVMMTKHQDLVKVFCWAEINSGGCVKVISTSASELAMAKLLTHESFAVFKQHP
jgi:hypothetical protein